MAAAAKVDVEQPVRTLNEFKITGILRKGESGNATTKPVWFDEERWERGRHYARDCWGRVFMSYQFILTVGLTVERFLHALIWSDKSSDPNSSRDRYIRVGIHMIEWYRGDDIWNSKSISAQSIAKVRKIHNAMGTAYNKSDKKVGTGQFFTQYDMAMVQAAFVAPPILISSYGGFNTKHLTHWVYFWRCLGYLLGIDDDHNICSSDAQAYQICYDVLYDVVLPGLKNPPDGYIEMATAYCVGSREIMLFKSLKLLTLPAAITVFYQLTRNFPGVDKNRIEKETPQWCQDRWVFTDRLRVWNWRFLIVLTKWMPFGNSFLNMIITRSMARHAKKHMDVSIVIENKYQRP